MAGEHVHSTEHWDITVAPDIPGARLHFRLAPRTPVADFLELTHAEMRDYWTALGWVYDAYELTYYCVVWRCGDQQRTGGADQHAAAYVVVGDPDSPTIARHTLSGAAQ